MRNTYNNEAGRKPAGEDAIKLLLIEDNSVDVFLIKHMLRDTARKQTFEFTDVPRMVDALKLLDASDEAAFDVVLLDLSLLDIDGVACVSALNQQTLAYEEI